MQVLDSIAEIGCGLGEGNNLQNPVGEIFVQDMAKQEESFGPVMLECHGTDESVVEDRDGIVAIAGSDGIKELSAVVDEKFCIVKSDKINASGMVDLVQSNLGDIECHQGEIKSSDTAVDECGVGILDMSSCGKAEIVSCSIEEGLEKVTLVGEEGCLAVDRSDVKEIGLRITSDGTDSASESDSKSESEDDSSSSSSSCDSSESDDEKEVLQKEKLCKENCEKIEHTADMEEGEIMDADADKMVAWTDDDDDDEEEEDDNVDISREDSELGDDIGDDEGDFLPKGPIRSKNELQDLPPVPPVNVSLQPNQQILPVGVVSSVLGTQVIVEGSEKHNPFSEGSIVWIAETRSPLGLVDEIFGPVKAPYYIIRYNAESDVPSGIQNGTAVGFVPEFVGHVLNDKSVYQKGYDASGENDEEVFEEAEFSDDEKEAEYRRMLKVSKRGNSGDDQGAGNKRKNKKNAKNRENTWARNKSSASQSPTVGPSQPTKMQQNMRAPSPSFNQGPQPGTSSVPASGQGNLLGPSSYMPQPAPALFNGNWTNGMASQQQNTVVPGAFQMTGMPWLPQNQFQPLPMPSAAPFPWPQQQKVPQFPFGNPGPSQQPFDLSQLVSGNSGAPLGPMNFAAGATNAQWPGLMGPNFSVQAPFFSGLQNTNVQLPMLSGFMPNGPQPAGPAGQSSNSLPGTGFPMNPEVPQRPFQGRGGHFAGRRGRGRKPFQGRGGRSGGARGLQQ